MWTVLLSIALLSESSAASSMVSLQPTAEGNFGELSVEIQFVGESDGSTEITFPDQWGPISDLSRFRTPPAFEAQSGSVISTETAPGHFLLIHEPSAGLAISYTVIPHDEDDSRWRDLPIPDMWPDLQPDYAVVIGSTFLPDLSTDDSGFRLVIEGNDPVHNREASLRLDEHGRSQEVTLGEIRNSVIFMGDIRVEDDVRDGLHIRLASRGEWQLDDSSFVDVVRTTLSTAGAIFNDNAFNDYLIALNTMPDLPNGSAIAGTGLNDSFYLFATSNSEPPQLIYTIVHEVLHEWITQRMGQTDDGVFTDRMWFAEGFTDYFTHLILLEAGYISFDGYLESMNELAVNYQLSPVNTVPVPELMSVLMTSYEASRLPYQRGALLAMHWDYQLRTLERRSLAEVVSVFLERARIIADGGEQPRLPDDVIYAILEDALGNDFTNLYASVLQAGEVFDLTGLSLPECLTTLEDDEGLIVLALANGADADVCRQTILNQ